MTLRRPRSSTARPARDASMAEPSPGGTTCPSPGHGRPLPRSRSKRGQDGRHAPFEAALGELPRRMATGKGSLPHGLGGQQGTGHLNHCRAAGDARCFSPATHRSGLASVTPSLAGAGVRGARGRVNRAHRTDAHDPATGNHSLIAPRRRPRSRHARPPGPGGGTSAPTGSRVNMPSALARLASRPCPSEGRWRSGCRATRIAAGWDGQARPMRDPAGESPRIHGVAREQRRE